MCGLFGFSDPLRKLQPSQARQLIRTLAECSMVRGTDATGIAYNGQNWLHLYKRNTPADKTPLFLPAGSHVVMGHVRMATQGDASFARNNHPFPGYLSRRSRSHGPDFALAHNGVLSNDQWLRYQFHLPTTNVQTDSYVAVQMLEAVGSFQPDALAQVAEQLEGTFTLTLLDRRDNLYFVRGNNPLSLVEFPRLGLFVYASTDAILHKTLSRLDFLQAQMYSRVYLEEGDILRLDADGRISTRHFDPSKLWNPLYDVWTGPSAAAASDFHANSLNDLVDTACNLGFEAEDVEILLSCGYSCEEIEIMLLEPELFHAALREAYDVYAVYGSGDLL